MTALQYLDDAPDSYRAGACNIGPAEIARRRRAGYVGLSAAIVLAILLVVFDAPAAARLAVAVPLSVGILGFLQARSRFCVAYGMGGLRNFGELGSETKVADAADRLADRRRAILMGSGAFIGSVAIAGVFALLPL
jgi:hypothetical protein